MAGAAGATVPGAGADGPALAGRAPSLSLPAAPDPMTMPAQMTHPLPMPDPMTMPDPRPGAGETDLPAGDAEGLSDAWIANPATGDAGGDASHLAALVNDALLEQARRHGWDL
jgi:hypothetical protein